jgi:hypothetical protein
MRRALSEKLTRRANHRHISIVARIEPAPGNWLWAFSFEIPESDGGRTSRRCISHRRLRRRQRAAVRTSTFEHRAFGNADIHVALARHLEAGRSLFTLAGARERAGPRRGEVHGRTRPPPMEIGFAPEMIASIAIMPHILFTQGIGGSMTAYLISLALAGLVVIVM